VKAGEYVAADLAQRAMAEDVLTGALDELCKLARLRHHWLLFCVNVEHTEVVAAMLNERGIATGVLTGTTPQDERRELLRRFKAGELRAISNCQVLTTGFDYPGVDCVVLMRPSMSKGLVLQMIGRGARQAEAKVDCVIFDYAGNIERHAPLDELWDIRPTPERRRKDDAARAHKEALVRARSAQEEKHDRSASLLDPMTGEPLATFTYAVKHVTYDLVKSKNPKYPGTHILVAKYFCPARKELNPRCPPYMWLYICVEYTGFARTKAEQWFKRRGIQTLPPSALAARRLAEGLEVPVSLRVAESTPYAEILVEHFQAREGN
jgi:DNA repair protein RadD